MKEKKQLTINILANLISFCITFGISFFLSPYIIENVGKEAYGFVSLSNDFVNYIALLTIALNSMASRFITIKIHQDKYDEAIKYFNSVLIGNIFISIVLILPSLLCVGYLDQFLNISADIVNDVKVLFSLTFVTFYISIISSTFSVAPYVKKRLDLAALRDIQATLGKTVVLFGLFLLFKPHVFYVGIAGLVYTIVLFVINIRYTQKLLPEIKIGFKYFDFKCIVEMITAGIWNVVSKISSILASELSLLISNIAIGDSAMGILSIAKTFPNIVLQLIGVLGSVFSPEFIVHYAKKDYKTLNHEIQFSMKFVGMFAGIPITLLIVLGTDLLKLWVPSVDTNVLYIMTIAYGIGFVFAGPVEPLYHVFTITNNVKVPSLYALITGILNVVLVLVGINLAQTDFIKMLIIMGTNTLFTVIRTTVFIPLYAAYCLDMKKTVFYPQIIKSILSVVIVSCTGLSISSYLNIQSWIKLILVAMVFVVCQLIINFVLFFNQSERIELVTLVKQKIKRN